MEPWQLPPETDCNDTNAWPPVFQSYESYKAELREAIRLHPPFGQWVRTTMTDNYVSKCSRTVVELQHDYIKRAAENNRARHFRHERLEHEIHTFTVACAPEIQEEKERSHTQMEAYAIALEQYQKARKGGYRVRAPVPPHTPLADKLANMQKELLHVGQLPLTFV